MNYLLDLTAQMVTSPASALREISNGERLRESFVIWIFSVVIISLTLVHSISGIAAGFVLTFLLMGFFLLFYSAVVDYTAGLAGGIGTAKGITAAFMASSLPGVFQAVLSILDFAGLGFLSGIGNFLIFLWIFVLQVIGISENYHFSKGKAFLVAIAPAIVIGLFVILFAIAAAVFAITGIMNMGDPLEMGGILNQI